MTNRTYTNRRPTSTYRKPKSQSRPIQEDCNIVTQSDERYCSTCNRRWDVDDDDTFECPKKGK